MTTYCIDPYSGATTEYENFNFNSLCLAHDGNYYGVTSTGIFALGGDYDVAEPIRSMVGFGSSDLEQPFKKHLSVQYAEVATETPLLSRVLVDESDYAYESRVCPDGTRLVRFTLGKGLRSTHFGFEVYNTCGGDFEMTSLETRVHPSKTRRI